jgi:putative ABC transport system ATP-binding protein
MDLLRQLGREENAAVIVVTHDQRMLEGFDRVYNITDGRVDIRRPAASSRMRDEHRVAV